MQFILGIKNFKDFFKTIDKLTDMLYNTRNFQRKEGEPHARNNT